MCLWRPWKEVAGGGRTERRRWRRCRWRRRARTVVPMAGLTAARTVVPTAGLMAARMAVLTAARTAGQMAVLTAARMVVPTAGADGGADGGALAERTCHGKARPIVTTT